MNSPTTPVGVTPLADTVTCTVAVPPLTAICAGDTVAATVDVALATVTRTVVLDGLFCASPR